MISASMGASLNTGVGLILKNIGVMTVNRHPTFFRWACCVLLTLLSMHVFAVPTGTGTISGIFTDDITTVGAPQRILLSDLGNLDLPVSEGAGTSIYQWGLSYPSRWFLDGVETPFADIAALNLPSSESDRVSFESGISDNQLSFDPSSFSNQPKGETFVAGLLEFNNGESVTGSQVSSVLLTLSTFSGDPDFTQMLDVPINIITTDNVSDGQGGILDIPSADFIYFADRPDLGSFRVFENESTSIEVLVEFNSLDLIGFGAVTDPSVGFLSSSVSNAIPEPTTLALMGLGLAGIGYRRHRSKIAA